MSEDKSTILWQIERQSFANFWLLRMTDRLLLPNGQSSSFADDALPSVQTARDDEIKLFNATVEALLPSDALLSQVKWIESERIFFRPAPGYASRHYKRDLIGLIGDLRSGWGEGFGAQPDILFVGGDAGAHSEDTLLRRVDPVRNYVTALGDKEGAFRDPFAAVLTNYAAILWIADYELGFAQAGHDYGGPLSQLRTLAARYRLSIPDFE